VTVRSFDDEILLERTWQCVVLHPSCHFTDYTTTKKLADWTVDLHILY